MRTLVIRVGVTIGLAVALLPFFFILLRLMVFETVPRDSYEGFVLWLAGEPEGALPESPFGYRVFFAALAVPFYKLLPAVTFSRLGDVSLPELRAMAAVAAVSYLATIAAAVAAYSLAVDKAGLGRLEGVIAGVLLFAGAWYCQIIAMDSVTLLLIALGIYLVDRPLAFIALSIVSIGFNEKALIVLAIWLLARVTLVAGDRSRFIVPLAAALSAIAVYIGVLAIVRLPGHEYQQDVGSYPWTALSNLGAYLSARGVVLNAFPALLLLLGLLLAWSKLGLPSKRSLFRPTDGWVIPGMLLVALVVTQMYQAGRMAMHALPLFVVPFAGAIGQWARYKSPKTGGAAALSDDGALNSPVGL